MTNPSPDNGAYLVPASPSALVAGDARPDEQHVELARQYAAASRSRATQRVYRGCLERWIAYCREQGIHAGPVEAPPSPAAPLAVAAWLAQLAGGGKSHSTVVQHRAALAFAHRAAGMADSTDHPSVAAVVDGIARTYGIAPRRQAPAATPASVRAMLTQCDATAVGLRDAALIAVWWAAALRSAEPAQLRVCDVMQVEDGAVIYLRRSKSDQAGRGTTIPIRRGLETEHVARWTDLARRDAARRGIDPETRPLFFDLRSGAALSPAACAAIVRRRASLAGVTLTGHSLRAGWATEAARRGVAFLLIQRHLRHKHASTTARYVRRGQLWEDAPPTLLEPNASRV